VAWESNSKDFRPFNGDFLVHLEDHSKEERALHAPLISNMLRPYLIGKETFARHDDAYFKLRAELEEVGAIQSDGTIMYEGATPGDIQ
jgi:hypothetical protein